MDKNPTIGFIGQGFIGKNYADDFEQRDHKIIRYDVDTYQANKDKIKDCDIVLIAVPTPTTPDGFNFDIIQEVLALVGKGNIAVIKSTVKLGTTKKLQALYPDITVMHSPEFLTEKTAARDAKHPDRNIIGITDPENKKLYAQAELVLSVLPRAPYSLITKVENAEMAKYGGNCWFYVKVVFMNMLYDLTQKHNLDFEDIKQGMAHDLRIGPTHLDVVHQGGRGAGGHCFIKDFEALIEMFEDIEMDDHTEILKNIRNLNVQYLRDSNKNLDLLKGVYGK
ncbi:UDP-glucose/GDP-mannose dehydrogenase family protein [Candidatus Parcubacteria bacterium]|jgi:UDPglucose 6-dehydrogenase|nr:UDP-glucose/GDP-mannose dehydrogenase family protein [Candidatus Parcubacteria bacterium]